MVYNAKKPAFEMKKGVKKHKNFCRYLFSMKMKVFSLIASAFALFIGASAQQNECVSFSVSQGTGCAWMCNYCYTTLGTTNYYFTDGICKYETGTGCVGNPIAGATYTCCAGSAVSNSSDTCEMA